MRMSNDEKWMVQYFLYDPTWEIDMVFNPGRAAIRGPGRPKVEYFNSENEAQARKEQLEKMGASSVMCTKC